MFQREDGVIFLTETDMEGIPGFDPLQCCQSCHNDFDQGYELPLEIWHSNGKILLQCCCSWVRSGVGITDSMLEKAVKTAIELLDGENNEATNVVEIKGEKK